MNFDALSFVKYGDQESLNVFLFENELQHRLFRQTLQREGIPMPVYPLGEVDTSNFDDWLLSNQVEHQRFAALLGLNNPFNMLDVDFGKESDFYDWLASHLYIHEQIAAKLHLSA